MDDNDTAVSASSAAEQQSLAERWLDVGTVRDLTKARRTVIDAEEPILIVAHDGSFHAMANICIHRQRELHKGVILNGRLVCPGHQWAFDLDCGWEAVKNQCQPTYTLRVTDSEHIEVDLNSRVVLVEPPSSR